MLIRSVPAALNPSDGEWWWTVGLDGIVGGLVGSVITIAAVAMTLRHERKIRADDLAHSQHEEFRTKVGRLHSLTLQSLFVLKEDAKIDAWSKVLQGVIEVHSIAKATEKVLARDLRSWMSATSALSRPRQTAEVEDLVQKLSVFLDVWLWSTSGLSGDPVDWAAPWDDFIVV